MKTKVYQKEYELIPIEMPPLPETIKSKIGTWQFYKFENGCIDGDEDMFYVELDNGFSIDLGAYGIHRQRLCIRVMSPIDSWYPEECTEKLCPETIEEAVTEIVRLVNKYSKYPKADEELLKRLENHRNDIDTWYKLYAKYSDRHVPQEWIDELPDYLK